MHPHLIRGLPVLALLAAPPDKLHEVVRPETLARVPEDVPGGELALLEPVVLSVDGDPELVTILRFSCLLDHTYHPRCSDFYTLILPPISLFYQVFFHVSTLKVNT